jgi:hypothetical protein
LAGYDDTNDLERLEKVSKLGIFSEFMYSSGYLMVRGVEWNRMLWYYWDRSMKDCRL